MACYVSITSIENTTKKLHIRSDFHFGCNSKLYHDEHEIIDELFFNSLNPLLEKIDHPALIQEWKQNIDASSYEKN